jgi:hypothetical protein
MRAASLVQRNATAAILGAISDRDSNHRRGISRGGFDAPAELSGR